MVRGVKPGRRRLFVIDGSKSLRVAVCRWKDGAMVLRWAASAYLATEKTFRRIMGHEQLWMLKSYLDGNEEAATVAANRKVG